MHGVARQTGIVRQAPGRRRYIEHRQFQPAQPCRVGDHLVGRHPVAAELTRVDVLPVLAGQEKAAASLTEARAGLSRLAAVDCPHPARSSTRAAARASAAGSVLPVTPAVTIAPSASRNSGPVSAAASPASATSSAR